MTDNFKTIKKNFFDQYLKYWILLFLLIIIFVVLNKMAYFTKNYNISNLADDMVYVTSGVAINKRFIITNKILIENACWSINGSKQGKFFVVTDRFIYPLVLSKKNNISNLILLKLQNKNDTLKYYSILQYGENKINKIIFPKPVNDGGVFIFQNAKVLDEKQNNNFFINVTGVSRNNNILGMPIFNDKYVLQGIVKMEDLNDEKNIINNLTGKRNYSVNDVESVRNFLKSNKIYFEEVDAINSLDNKKYNVKKSVVNIICKKVY
jgi:hypothetical protein